MSVIDSLLAENAEAVLRESLSNVVRHAAADTATVTVTVSVYDNLTIEVADNGVGIPDDAVIRRLDNLAARHVRPTGGSASTRPRAAAPRFTGPRRCPDLRPVPRR